MVYEKFRQIYSNYIKFGIFHAIMGHRIAILWPVFPIIGSFFCFLWEGNTETPGGLMRCVRMRIRRCRILLCKDVSTAQMRVVYRVLQRENVVYLYDVRVSAGSDDCCLKG